MDAMAEKNSLVLKEGAYEIVALSEAFQKTLDKIYDNYEKERLFSVNVAHELRTPLAVLRTRVDVFKKKEAPWIRNSPPLWKAWKKTFVASAI